MGDVFELASVAVFAGSSSLPVAAHLYFLGLCSLFSDQPQRLILGGLLGAFHDGKYLVAMLEFVEALPQPLQVLNLPQPSRLST